MPFFFFRNTPVKPSNDIESTLDLNSFLDVSAFGAYQRSEIAVWTAFGGVCLSIMFSIICITAGILISVHKGPIDNIVLPPIWSAGNFPTIHKVFTGLIAIFPAYNSRKTEILSLLLNLIVTGCTESIGFLHAVALRSALASEGRLTFNTSLRLFTASSGNRWTNPNGPFLNAIMAITLVISYASSSLVFIPFVSLVTDSSSSSNWWSTCVFAVPTIILGVTLLLQTIIALLGIYRVKVLTWSSSPFDTTIAMLRDARITRAHGRCMHSVADRNTYPGPRAPCELQPSAWQSHPSIKTIVILLWAVGLACAAWGGAAMGLWYHIYGQVEIISLALLPNQRSIAVGYYGSIDPDHGYYAWVPTVILFVVVQGSLTFALHCAEVIVNVIRDEVDWRKATSSTGMRMSRNPLVAVIGSWPNLGLLITKPMLHWVFGLSLNVQGFVQPLGNTLISVEVIARPIQIWYLSAGIFVFALVATLMANYHPRGPQPVAFGHVQTLADLVDVWTPTMWWGHKDNMKPVCHAGTSDWPLPPVKMTIWYT